MIAFSLVPMLVAAANLPVPPPEHDLRFNTPARVWDEALPLGNGILGALVWGDGRPVKISLDRTDLWDLRPVPEFHSDEYSYTLMRQWEKEGRVKDLLRVYDNPYHRPGPTKIPAGRIELQFPKSAKFRDTDLSLATATARMGFEDDTELKVWIHAEEAVGLIEVVGNSGVTPDLVVPKFGGKEGREPKAAIVAGELAELGYSNPVEHGGENWTAYEQKGWGGFHFAVYLAWRAVETPKPCWMGAWSVASSLEDDNPLALAKARVEKALSDSESVLRASHEAWWQRYWHKSWISVPNPVVERQWYLDTYKFGAASRLGHPPITLQGPWTADDGKLPPWKGDYHHDLNTQLSYWPCYSGNRLEEGRNYVDWLWATRDTCREWTRRFFDLPGLCVPMTADLNNDQIGGWRQYTHSATTGAWLAHHFYLHWQFSMDRDFLRDRAYPYLRECAVFLEAVTNERDEDGRRTLPLSSSPEINDNRPEAWFPSITNYDLALIRWLFGATAELARELGKDDDATHWDTVLAEMLDFSLAEDGRLLVARDYPLKESHRHFSHLMAIHPLGLIDVAQGNPGQRTVAAALAELKRLGSSLWTGYSFAWLANIAARGHDGARAEKALETFTCFTLRNSFHCNGDQSGQGHSNFTYRPFTLEGNFAAAAGLQEMLLQSHTGIIDIFPAIPEGWKDVTFHHLRARGAFLVSAQRRDGRVTRVEIEADGSGNAQNCRIRSPFTGEILTKTVTPGETLVLTPDEKL